MKYFLLLKNEILGEIRQNGFGIELLGDARKLSPAMLTNDVTYFLENLLPEGYELEKMAAACKRSTSDKFGLVCDYGEDMPGAVRVLSEDRLKDLEKGGYLPLGEKEFSSIVLSMGDFSFEEFVESLQNNRNTRLSLPGAQGKFGVAIFDGELYKPVDGALSTHIVKYDNNPSFPDVSLNEFVCMSLAKRIGLNVANVDYDDLSQSIIIERYDRKVTNFEVEPLHQIDFCQALNLPSTRKYQQDSDDPGFREMVKFANDYLPYGTNKQLFEYTLFSHLIGNRDNHLKNHSIVFSETGEAELAPLYDVVCTDLYPGLSKKMALQIADSSDSHSIDSEMLGKTFSVKMDTANKKVIGMIKAIDSAFKDQQFLQQMDDASIDGLEMVYKIKSVFDLNKSIALNFLERDLDLATML